MVAGGVLLLTGVPRIGKTTVIRRVADRLKEKRLGGFYTEEIRGHGGRRGFRLVGFDGPRGSSLTWTFPRFIGSGSTESTSRRSTGRANRLGLDPAEVYLVDEIGKMECLSDRFVSGMRALLAGPRPVVATVALHGSGFIEEVKRGRGAVIWEVTHANREKLPVQVLGWLTGSSRRECHSRS